MRYVGLALGGVLLLELALTRVYSVTQGYHFAFLAVSLGCLDWGQRAARYAETQLFCLHLGWVVPTCLGDNAV